MAVWTQFNGFQMTLQEVVIALLLRLKIINLCQRLLSFSHRIDICDKCCTYLSIWLPKIGFYNRWRNSSPNMEFCRHLLSTKYPFLKKISWVLINEDFLWDLKLKLSQHLWPKFVSKTSKDVCRWLWTQSSCACDANKRTVSLVCLLWSVYHKLVLQRRDWQRPSRKQETRREGFEGKTRDSDAAVEVEQRWALTRCSQGKAAKNLFSESEWERKKERKMVKFGLGFFWRNKQLKFVQK